MPFSVVLQWIYITEGSASDQRLGSGAVDAPERVFTFGQDQVCLFCLQKKVKHKKLKYKLNNILSYFMRIAEKNENPSV